MAQIISKDRVPYRIWDKINGVWNKLNFTTNAKSVDADDGKTLETKVGALNGITSDLSCEDESIAISAKAVNDSLTAVNTNLEDECNLNTTYVDSSWTGSTNKIIEKNGIVTISLGIKSKSALNTYTTFATIPSQFAPKSNIVWTVMRHGDYFGLGGIDTSGNIQMYTNGGSSVVATELISFTITYNKNI